MTSALLVHLATLAAILGITIWVAVDASRAFRSPFLKKVLALVVYCPTFMLATYVVLCDNAEARQARLRAEQEREARAQIEATLCEVAKLVSENDFDSALEFVSERAPQTRELIMKNRHGVRVKEARATDIQIERLDLNARPPGALASFHASIRGTASVWPMPQRFPYVVECDVLRLELRREPDGIWRAQDRYTIVPTNPNP